MKVSTNQILWLLAGILSIMGGFFAFANPFAATLTAELLTVWRLCLVG